MTPITSALAIITAACTLSVPSPTPMQKAMAQWAQAKCLEEARACMATAGQRQALKAHTLKHGDPGALLVGVGTPQEHARACVSGTR